MTFPSFEPVLQEERAEDEEEATLREVLEEPLPRDALIPNLSHQIMEEEDRRILEILDAAADGEELSLPGVKVLRRGAVVYAAGPPRPACSRQGHEAYLRPIEECAEPECAARQVVEE